MHAATRCKSGVSLSLYTFETHAFSDSKAYTEFPIVSAVGFQGQRIAPVDEVGGNYGLIHFGSLECDNT